MLIEPDDRSIEAAVSTVVTGDPVAKKTDPRITRTKQLECVLRLPSLAIVNAVLQRTYAT